MRDHGFPANSSKPSLVVTARAIDRRKGETNAMHGVKVVTMADERWRRPEIKTLQLLPNVLAKQGAREQGAYEAWLVDAAGRITEGSSTNAWILTKSGTLVTRQVDQAILRGITRGTLMRLLSQEGIRIEERPFSLDETYAATEAFLTSAANGVMPVVAVNDRSIGDGRPGEMTLKLRKEFYHFAEITALLPCKFLAPRLR
jgi:D-alanine transaminase